MQLWPMRTTTQPIPSPSSEGGALKTSDCIALVALVLVIIAMPMLFDLAMALGIAH